MIRVETLAKDIESKLEDISFGLYGEEFPQFNMTDNIQIYHSKQIKKGGRRYTPGIIRQIPGGMTPDSNWGVYSSQFEIEIYGYREERDQVKEIIRELVKEYNGRAYDPEPGNIVIDDNKIGVLAIGDLIFDSFVNSEDGTNTERFTAHFNLVISVFMGGLSAKETSLKIEGIEIPFDEIQYKQDKSLLPNIEYKDSNESPNISDKLTYELITFNIPFNISSEVDELILSRALNPTYNDLFTIEWDLGIGIKTGQYVLRSSFIQYSQSNEAIGILLTFESSDNIQVVKIDGETIPILEFGFTSVRGTESFNTEHSSGNIEVLQTPVTYSYGISMVLLYDSNIDVLRQIRDDIITNKRETPREIELILEKETVTFNTFLIEGTWSFNERANQTIHVSFAGEKII